ncbi:MAG: hypothetical protein AAFU64_02600, partial [Bacteroidota bacterium]
TRIYTGTDQKAYFEEQEIALKDQGEIGFLSQAQEVEHIIFRENAADYDWDFHNAPARQWIILLDGHIEIEVSSGEKRNFQGGDVLLVEDTEGEGHRTRHLISQKRKSIFITLKQ